MYAVVATGGKQLKVAVGDVVSVEKLDAPVGETVNFSVIFLADEGEITVDSEALASASVTGEVIEHFKGEKAIVFKFKKRKGYKRLKGHRQNLTRVRITDVASAGKPATKKAATAEKAEPAKKAAPKAAAKTTKAAEAKAATTEAAPKKAAPKKAATTEAAPKKAAPKKAAEAKPASKSETAAKPAAKPAAKKPAAKKPAAKKAEKPAKAPSEATDAAENE